MSEVIERYQRDGYVVMRRAFDPEIAQTVSTASGLGAIAVVDSQGARQELNVWTDCGDDLLGVIPRSASMVALAEQLIGEPVYHWHSKISWKKPHSAGTWDWHQDYGFWREEGCARPLMTTVSIALDHQAVANGCLRVIPGSHLTGDIAHIPIGTGRGADPAVVDELLAAHGVVELELDAGDLVAFDCRTLHGSGPNIGDTQRSILHCSYNAVTNGPTNPALPGHAVNQLMQVSDDDVLAAARGVVSGDSRFIPAAENGYTNDGYTVLDGDAPVLDG